MIFGRKRRSVDIEPVDTEEEALEIVGNDAGDHESEVDEELADGTREPLSLDEGEFEDGDLDADELAAEDEVSEDFADPVDWRSDGPFDTDEVELSGDSVTRVDLGALVVTPWDGLGLQLQVNEATRAVQAVHGGLEEFRPRGGTVRCPGQWRPGRRTARGRRRGGRAGRGQRRARAKDRSGRRCAGCCRRTVPAGSSSSTSPASGSRRARAGCCAARCWVRPRSATPTTPLVGAVRRVLP